ncbi:glycosyltransferase involved in cell wall bisynthesis [Jatrophihabitans sp. GAS493]|uniref:glycosyltransferase family 4 protein n=1 Tax=Jatrophihabitans sp. GAS493 TaxID=1907575 RepID=UPI000BB76B0F|nr:glycosyltransferase family 4 protein [Jatrophihabitans sp. GAS493]SOD71583.1 glycosyltransferase involved in cell wall bisynthesis [Jatrophihabitans sp. GAS493]
MTLRVLALDRAVGLWGAQVVLLQLAQPLAERGIEVTLATPPRSDFGDVWRAQGHPAITLQTAPGVSPRTDGSLSLRALAALSVDALRSTGQLARVARDFDLLHGNGHDVHLTVAVAGRLSRVPSLLHLHEELPYRLGRAIRTSAVWIGDSSVAVSEAVRQNSGRLTRRRIDVIPNGVRTDSPPPDPGATEGLRREFGVSEGDVLVAAVTRLDPVKRVQDLLAALHRLRDVPGWRAVIFGDTSSFPEYAAQLRRSAGELGGRVLLAGRREDIPAVLRACDLLVHPGMVEGMPLGIMEAQAAGVPVVAYRVAGIPEVVLDGVTGLLAEPGDVDELARHMKRLLTTPALRSEFGRAGHNRALMHFSLETQADSYAAVARSLTARRSRPRT